MTIRNGDIRVLPKVPSLIRGLDEILLGGLPEGRTTLIVGGPGTGKSVLGLEFLYRSALNGNAGIFITFEERSEAVRRNAATMGWDLAGLEQSGKFALIEARLDPVTVISGDFDLSGLLAIIDGQAKALGAKNIVFDAIDVLLRFYDNPLRERRELYALYEWLLDRELTGILTVKSTENADADARYEYLEFMADCVIRLIQKPGEWVSTRVIQVIKFRGSDFGRNSYPFVIDAGGIIVVPISEFGLQQVPTSGPVSSGNARLDTLLGGGYRKRSSVLITGASGTGKSTLANTFIVAACARGEKVLSIGFEESLEQTISTMLSPGIDLRPAIESGMLKMLTAMPEATSTEKHLVAAFRAIDDFQPENVVVDAVSAFERMGSRRAAFEFAMRLISRCRDRGITIILNNQSSAGDKTHLNISGLGISSLIDTIIWLQLVEKNEHLERRLLVIKSRGMHHSHQYHRFKISENGIIIYDDNKKREGWDER